MKKHQHPVPEPVSINVVCSLCGEPWNQHQEVDGEVTTLECIRLLKAKPPVYVPQYQWWYQTWPTKPPWPIFTISAGGTSGARALPVGACG